MHVYIVDSFSQDVVEIDLCTCIYMCTYIYMHMYIDDWLSFSPAKVAGSSERWRRSRQEEKNISYIYFQYLLFKALQRSAVATK